jgi:hypothetical protein
VRPPLQGKALGLGSVDVGLEAPLELRVERVAVFVLTPPPGCCCQPFWAPPCVAPTSTTWCARRTWFWLGNLGSTGAVVGSRAMSAALVASISSPIAASAVRVAYRKRLDQSCFMVRRELRATRAGTPPTLPPTQPPGLLHTPKLTSGLGRGM